MAFGERNTLIVLAKIAEQAGRYNDVIDAMKKLVKLKLEMTEEERRLVSVGYKKVVEAQRASWTTVSLLERNEANMSYLQRIEQEITDICNEAMWLAEYITSYISNKESMVFFMKMVGDYLRYVAEVKTGKDRERVAENSLKAYKLGMRTAHWADLGILHPLQLSLVLNTAVLHNDVMGCPEKACEVAWTGFDLAMQEIHTLMRNDRNYEESKSILRLLRENIALWTNGEIPQEGIPKWAAAAAH